MRILVLLLALLTSGPASAGADVQVRTVTVDTPDGPRSAIVASPPGAVRPGRPLVLLFHGHMGSARNTLGEGLAKASPLAAWLPIVEREGVVVAALDGARGGDGQQGWNDGRPGGVGNPKTDDVAYARAVIETVGRDQRTDPARTFAMGMSNGGVFAFRLARELDPPLAAIAACCASMPGEAPPAPPRAKVSVLMIEGTEDLLMPYAGGQVGNRRKPRGAVLGTDVSLAYWRAADGLAEAPVEREAVPHRRAADATRVTRATWGVDGGPQVRLLRVVGGGHCEPSLAHAYGRLYTTVCGRQNRDVESAEEAWRFFRGKHAAVRVIDVPEPGREH